jgi:hypothetical protein
MVFFADDKLTDVCEINSLSDEEIRLVIPCEKYFILATSKLVSTNKGVLRKAVSGEIVLYQKTLETLIKDLKTSKEHHKMDLLSSIGYVSYNPTET